MSVVTRFAPSPTGFLHIGGARTALFNYLFAAHHGGRYLLRIEDTDKKRSTIEAIEAIHEGLNWLGLSGDGDVILQSERAERHRHVAEEMLIAGTAYKCFLSEEELADIRAVALRTGKPVRSPWRDRSDLLSEQASYVVRLKMPDEGVTTIQDMVQGDVSVQNSSLDDLVLLRSDGTPTYMLAVVVDDYDMNITHVIRGDDHLNNAFRQYHIYEGAGWPVPVFGHIPLIHGPDGAKLSKRHGALGVDTYRDMGFLPEAVSNYLSRLGWSHGDDELFSREQAASWFDGKHIGKAPARFDVDKLKAVNQYWLRKMPADELAEKLIVMRGGVAAAQSREWLNELMPLFTERAQTLVELSGMTDWLFNHGAPTLNEDAVALLTDEAKHTLQKVAQFLSTCTANKAEFDTAFKDWMAAEGLKMRDVGLPLRAALTGTRTAPSILDIIRGLGTKETLNRINQICT